MVARKTFSYNLYVSPGRYGNTTSKHSFIFTPKQIYWRIVVRHVENICAYIFNGLHICTHMPHQHCLKPIYTLLRQICESLKETVPLTEIRTIYITFGTYLFTHFCFATMQI